jgi:hypothetical protein
MLTLYFTVMRDETEIIVGYECEYIYIYIYMCVCVCVTYR